MSVAYELQAIVDHIKPLHATATYYKQGIPETQVPNTFVVRFQHSAKTMETNLRMLNANEYQLVYFGTSASDVLARMEAVSRQALNMNMLIPINDGSLRYIRVESFSFAMPIKTEANIDAIIGVLTGQVRECRDQQAYEKIMHVYGRFNITGN